MPNRSAQLPRQRVLARVSRQRCVKRGVEHRDMRHLRIDLARLSNSSERWRIVQWRQVTQLFDLAENVVVDQRRTQEALASVDDAMDDRIWLTAFAAAVA